MHTTIVAPTCPSPECTLTVTDVEALLPALDDYIAQFAPAFARADQHAWARRYLHGLLLPLPRTSCEPIALALDVSVRRLQSFMSESTWSATAVRTIQEHLIARSLGDPDGRVPAVIVPAWSGRGRKPRKQRLKTPTNTPYRVDEVVGRLPKRAWTRATIKEGSKGPIICDLAFVRVREARDGLPGPRLWLIIRRNVDNPNIVKCSLSNAPATIETTRLARMGGMRWPIELTFEVGKDELGMDHYETRGWVGWHHHMALVMLVHHFLVWIRQNR